MSKHRSEKRQGFSPSSFTLINVQQLLIFNYITRLARVGLKANEEEEQEGLPFVVWWQPPFHPTTRTTKTSQTMRIKQKQKKRNTSSKEMYTNWDGSVLSALQIFRTNLYCENAPLFASLSLCWLSTFFNQWKYLAVVRSVIVKCCMKTNRSVNSSTPLPYPMKIWGAKNNFQWYIHSLVPIEINSRGWYLWKMTQNKGRVNNASNNLDNLMKYLIKFLYSEIN